MIILDFIYFQIIGIGRKLHELLTGGLLTLCKSTVMSLASFERSFGLARGSLMVERLEWKKLIL